MRELPPAENAQRWFRLFRRELQIRITKVVAIDEGWDSMVYEVNDDWIVRVPRRPEIEALLGKEVSLLAALARTLSVSVPRLRLVADADVCIVIYQKIIGLESTTPSRSAPTRKGSQSRSADFSPSCTGSHKSTRSRPDCPA